MPRFFTPMEANDALAQVRPLAEELIRRREDERRAFEHHADLAARIAGNGGGIDAQRLADAEADLERARVLVARTLNEIHVLGAIVKDPDTGLVDFPALHGDEEVLLCWRVGEDAVEWWHTLEGGFAGRKRLPFE